MTTLKNVSFYGDLDVPALGRIVKFGETVDVDDEALAQSLVDGGHFEEVTAEPTETPTEGDSQENAAESGNDTAPTENAPETGAEQGAAQ